jgi:hypothetical protein
VLRQIVWVGEAQLVVLLNTLVFSKDQSKSTVTYWSHSDVETLGVHNTLPGHPHERHHHHSINELRYLVDVETLESIACPHWIQLRLIEFAPSQCLPDLGDVVSLNFWVQGHTLSDDRLRQILEYLSTKERDEHEGLTSTMDWRGSSTLKLFPSADTFEIGSRSPTA